LFAPALIRLREYKREGRWSVVRAGPVAEAEVQRALA
jgi:hypothetical protein